VEDFLYVASVRVLVRLHRTELVERGVPACIQSTAGTIGVNRHLLTFGEPICIWLNSDSGETSCLPIGSPLSSSSSNAPMKVAHRRPIVSRRSRAFNARYRRLYERRSRDRVLAACDR
jgi:hypothetical protein